MKKYGKIFCLFVVVLLASLVARHASAATGAAVDFLTPKPTGNTINDGWSPDGTNFYFAGDGGTILHYDGESFEVMDTPTESALYGIHGTSASDIWAVGGEYYGFAATEQGRSVILHYDGTQWSRQTPPADSFGQYHIFTDVWCDGAGAVWAVADLTTLIARSTGGAWAFTDTGLTLSSFGFHAIYGFSPTDVYAAGGCGQIVHYTGTWQLERMTDGGCSSGTTDILYDVWGPEASNVFATGNWGQALKRAGDGTWGTIHEGSLFSDASKTSICGASATDVYFAGYAGEIDHWDGSSYTRILASGTDKAQYTMLRQAAGAYLLGLEYGKIASFDGTARVAETTPAVVDEHWKFVQRAERAWLVMPDMDSGDPIYGWDGRTLITLDPGLPGQYRMTAFRAFAEDDLFLAGYGLGSGGTLAKRYDGSTWSSVDVGYDFVVDAALAGSSLFTLRGTTWDDGYDSYLGAPCTGGSACYSSESFRAMTTGSDGVVYAVGKGGAVVAYRDGAWATEASGTTKDLTAVAAGGGFVCAAGRDRTLIVKADDGAWGAVTGLPLLAENTFVGIAHTGEGRFMAVLNTGNDGPSNYLGADKGAIYEIVDGAATLVRAGLSSTLAGIGSNAAGDVATAGTGGVLLGNALTAVGGAAKLVPINLLLLLRE